MGKFDNLSSDKFWDLVYETAKNKKKRKSVWRTLMSPEYSDTVRVMAERHMQRLSADITQFDIDNNTKIINAYRFIQTIRGAAIHAMERHIADEKNIRRYADIADLYDYVAYLKDTIEDLRSYVPDSTVVFDLYASVEDMKNDSNTQIDDWINRRVRRRGEYIELD